MTSFKKSAAVLAMLASTGAAPVFAATASADMDVTAGLAPVMVMTCTPLKFGVWRVPVRNTGNATVVELSLTSDTPTVNGNTTGVALSTTAGWGAARGQCTMSGSAAADATQTAISATNMAQPLFPDNNSAYPGLAAPLTDVSLTYDLIPATTSTITNGGTTFYVGGQLNIPETIISANYGAYKTSLAPVITVDDQQP